MLASTSHRMTLFAGAAFVALAAAGSASAQTTPATSDPAVDAVAAQPSTPPTEDAEGDATITVTGSRIVRDGFSAPTPVTVVTQEEIENSSPTNNIADFVNQLPQLAGSVRPANSRLELSNGIAGINALNLRNLGTFRNLVLLNGRRSVGSTAFGVVESTLSRNRSCSASKS